MPVATSQYQVTLSIHINDLNDFKQAITSAHDSDSVTIDMFTVNSLDINEFNAQAFDNLKQLTITKRRPVFTVTNITIEELVIQDTIDLLVLDNCNITRLESFGTVGCLAITNREIKHVINTKPNTTTNSSPDNSSTSNSNLANTTLAYDTLHLNPNCNIATLDLTNLTNLKSINLTCIVDHIKLANMSLASLIFTSPCTTSIDASKCTSLNRLITTNCSSLVAITLPHSLKHLDITNTSITQLNNLINLRSCIGLFEIMCNSTSIMQALKHICKYNKTRWKTLQLQKDLDGLIGYQ